MHRYPSSKRSVPSSGANAIARPRLEVVLDDASAGRRATLVIAPAGYGKTTAVVGWLARRERPAAWFTFDPGDDDGDPDISIAACLGAALAATAPTRGRGLAADAAPAAATPTALAADVEASGWSGVLVLDDVHHLGAAAAGSLATWVERAPSGVHTVVLARHAPALPIARWLTRGDAELIGVDALRLDRGEGLALIASLLPELSGEHAEALWHRVEGWPAGVQLAARSLRGRHDPLDHIERFTGTDRYVLAFLTEEVLLRLPDELHEAALLLADEPRLCGGLVDALTLRRDGVALLERLEAHEAFLERLDPVNPDADPAASDRDGPWYRFPDFFRDLLSHRLTRTHPGLAQTLRDRSSAWWAARHAAAPDDAAPAANEVGHPEPEAGAEAPSEPLTSREHDVLRLLAAGASTKAIARALDLSPNTVKSHTRHLFDKLGVRTRTEAAVVARRRGLVEG